MRIYEMACHEEDTDSRGIDRVSAATWVTIAILFVAAAVLTVAGYMVQVIGGWIIVGALWGFYDSFDRGCWWGLAQLIVSTLGVLIGAIVIGAA